MAIHWASIGPLIVTSLAIMGSPGPVTVSLTAAGSAYGVRRSFAYMSGAIAGTAIVLVAVATGITAVLLAVPALRVILIASSAAYILWLAYHVATAPPLSSQAAAGQAPTLVGGTWLGVANPKAWVAIGAVFASTHLADAATIDAVAKIAVLTVMIIVICSTWLIAGASLARPLREPRSARIINVALAVALVAATVLAIVH